MTALEIEVADCSEAIERCHAEGWTDGLPVVPPTDVLVDRYAAASAWAPDAVLLREPVRGVEVTAAAVIVNCVLAGCLPEHLPVVGAVLRAMDHPDFRVHIAVSSTGGPAPVVIVNGPIRETLGMNGSGNLFGPGNRANSSIGRAIRLVLRNCLGALPGVLDQATQGWFGKFSACFPEREEASPWEPLHVRRGFPASTSTVTVLATESSHSVLTRSGVTADMILFTATDVLRTLGSHSDGQGYLVFSPEHARILADEGWTVPAIQAHLFDGSRRTIADLRRGGRLDLPIVDGDDVRTRPRARVPSDILVAVGGSDAGCCSAWFPSWSRGRASVAITAPVAADGPAVSSEPGPADAPGLGDDPAAGSTQGVSA